MIALEEDIKLPRIYGPLLERGMSLREIRKHTKWEIFTMLRAIHRYNIVIDGQQITEDMRKNDPNSVLIYNLYLEEIDKFKRQSGVKDESDTAVD